LWLHPDSEIVLSLMVNGQTSSMQVLEAFRIAVTPYLPPPVILAIRKVDELFGTEASMMIFFTLITVMLLNIILSRSSTRKAVEDEQVMGLTQINKKSVSGTCLICGPSGGGKTALFHTLCAKDDKNRKDFDIHCSGSREIHHLVVTSMKASEGLVDFDSSKKSIRLIDFPGHNSLLTSLPSAALQHSNCVLLVLDSSKSISEAANVLYLLLTDQHTVKSWKNYEKKLPIMVVCNKTDLPVAKNYKRIKLQLRSELERLRKVRSSAVTGMDSGKVQDIIPLGDPGKNLDLDTCNGLPCTLSFVSISCIKKSDGQEGLNDVREFIRIKSTSNGLR